MSEPKYAFIKRNGRVLRITSGEVSMHVQRGAEFAGWDVGGGKTSEVVQPPVTVKPLVNPELAANRPRNLYGYHRYKDMEKPVEVAPIKRRTVSYKIDTVYGYAYDGYGNLMINLAKRVQSNELSHIKLDVGTPRNAVRYHPSQKVVLLTMFEADRIPDAWTESCNTADGIIVPSKWCKDVFIASGVTVPIEVVNLAVENFNIVTPDTKPFIFAHQNSFVDGDQKGWSLVIKAFKNLFRSTSPELVRLILKGREHCWANDDYYIRAVVDDPRIDVQLKTVSHAAFINWWNPINCFVFPSRGEGFGLPPVEAMAHGIPTIMTNAHSMTEFSKYGIPIGVRGNCSCYYVGRVFHNGVGNWVEPDLRELEAAMWDVYSNYAKYKAAAVANAEEIRKRFNWDTMLDNIEIAINKLVG
jgi:glycosyltransferase involved in cell wall biosynthesis